MYQALYRKYRPTTFDEVIGQDVITNTLKNAIQNNKVTHAYLFTGPRGTGKTSVAKIFAKTINCENINNGIPCNKCTSCELINNKQSTDIIEIDAASNNGVNEIRNLKSKITLVPSNSKYKIYIIDEVHMLSDEAFNALLKTLEEPPKHVIFILATTEPQKLPLTILSRCQRYDFKRISNEKNIMRLKKICENEKIAIDDEALAEIARISDGGLRDSISLLDQVCSYKVDKITANDVHMVNGTLTQRDLCEFMENVFSNNVENTLKLVDKYNDEGKSIIKLVDEIIYYLRNLLIYMKTPKYLEEKNIDIKAYSEIAKTVDIKNIYELIENFNKLKLIMKDASNIKILFEIEILKYLGSKNISQEIKEVPNTVEKVIKTEQILPKNTEPAIFDCGKHDSTIDVDLRVNNTLSRFDKKKLLKLKDQKEAIRFYLLDDEYGKGAALLLDGEIKAASDEYIIFVYKDDNDVNSFNSNVEKLENIIRKSLKEEYKLVSVSDSVWEKIKNEFNNKLKTYEYKKEETKVIKKLEKKESKDEINLLFDDIVEYVEEEIK